MRIAIGSDHAGFELKQELRTYIEGLGHTVLDVGAHAERPGDDYPDYADALGTALRAGQVDRGVLVCGSGVGVSVAANKMPGVRAAVCHDVHSAHQCVEHDDVNVMCIGAQIVGPWLAKDLVAAYLDARFSTDEDFRRRVAKLAEMDAGR